MTELASPLLDGPGTWAGQKETLGFWSAIFSLSVSMLGTGIVAFPYAFALCGYVGGPFWLVAFALLGYLSYLALLRCTIASRIVSYTDLAKRAGPAVELYTTVSLWGLLLMATAAYVLISGDVIRSVAGIYAGETPPTLLSNPVLFALILAVIYPFCLTTSLQGLSLVTAYCTGAIFAVVGIIIYACAELTLQEPPPPQLAPVATTGPAAVILALPILGCAMFGHMNMGQVYAELLPEAKSRATLVPLLAVALVTVLYSAVGACGYAAFGRTALPDVVAELSARHGGGPVSVCQGLLVSFIVLKTPLMLFPLRTVTLSVWSSLGRSKAADSGEELSASLKDLSLSQNASLTLLLLCGVYGIAVAIPDLGTLLGILGAVCVVPLTTIVPGYISWVTEEPRPTASCAFLGIVGLLVSVLSLVDVFATL